MQTQLVSNYARVNTSIAHKAAINASAAFQLQTSTIKDVRWVCHVSSKTKLKASHKLVLNIKPSESFSTFDIIERLLFSKTCDFIYSDEQLPLHQVQMLKQMAIFSGTELAFISDKVEFNLSQTDILEEA
jgi:hypothetical protein